MYDFIKDICMYLRSYVVRDGSMSKHRQNHLHIALYTANRRIGYMLFE